MTRAINCAIAAYTERESERVTANSFWLSCALLPLHRWQKLYVPHHAKPVHKSKIVHTSISSAEWWAAMGKWIRGHDVKEALLQLQMSNPLRPCAILFQAYHLLIRSGQMKSLVLCEDLEAGMLFKALHCCRYREWWTAKKSSRLQPN